MSLRIKSLLLIVALVLIAVAPAYSQGCAMCAQNAAAQSAKAQRALNNGILMLVTPTVILFGGVFFLAYRRRN